MCQGMTSANSWGPKLVKECNTASSNISYTYPARCSSWYHDGLVLRNQICHISIHYPSPPFTPCQALPLTYCSVLLFQCLKIKHCRIHSMIEEKWFYIFQVRCGTHMQGRSSFPSCKEESENQIKTYTHTHTQYFSLSICVRIADSLLFKKKKKRELHPNLTIDSV